MEGPVESHRIEPLAQGTVVEAVDPIREIGADASLEEDRDLEDHPDSPAQRSGLESSDVRAVEQDLSGMRLLEPVQAAKEAGLASTRWTYDGGNQSALEGRVDIGEHPVPGAHQADASGLERER
jgi:hypothetical protein